MSSLVVGEFRRNVGEYHEFRHIDYYAFVRLDLGSGDYRNVQNHLYTRLSLRNDGESSEVTYVVRKVVADLLLRYHHIVSHPFYLSYGALELYSRESHLNLYADVLILCLGLLESSLEGRHHQFSHCRNYFVRSEIANVQGSDPVGLDCMVRVSGSKL